MPKYVIPEGPSLTGSLPGSGRGGGIGFGAMGIVHGSGGGMGHGRRYSHFAPVNAAGGNGGGRQHGGGRSSGDFGPGGGGENNGSGRTTPSSVQVRNRDHRALYSYQLLGDIVQHTSKIRLT